MARFRRRQLPSLIPPVSETVSIRRLTQIAGGFCVKEIGARMNGNTSRIEFLNL